MSTHKNINKICCAVLVFTLLITVLFMHAGAFGVEIASKSKGYESRLFDVSKVHTLNIVMDDWDSFIATCTNEEYTPCSVIIDGQSYKNVGLRAKGNTSLTQVANYGNDRYSFKIEFDHYDNGKSYYGLDKLSLNNIIQDNTYMKDYLCYRMMSEFGVCAPLCSYVQVLKNGEEYGLYLAVEGVEESFLERNFGSDYGNLYKPDSQKMGAGAGNGAKFNMEDWTANEGTSSDNADNKRPDAPPNAPQGLPADAANSSDASAGKPFDPQMQSNRQDMFRDQDRGIGSSDVSLIYSDDNYESYSNIFDNAKTAISNADKDRLISSLKRLNENEGIENTVDIEQVIRYFTVHNFVCNFDSYTGSMIHNYYLYEKDGKLSMIPWDYNLAFGGFQGSSNATALVNFPIDTPVSGGSTDSRPMLAWIFGNETYTQLYHSYFSDFITEFFDSGAFTKELDATKALISDYVESDPTKFCTYEEFEAGVAALREFCLLRAQSIKGQLDGSVPSTSDEQAAAQELLIDASSVSVSAMGNMNSKGGKAGDNPKAPDTADSSDSTESSAIPSGNSLSNNNPAPPDLPFGGNDAEAPPQNSGDAPPNDATDSDSRFQPFNSHKGFQNSEDRFMSSNTQPSSGSSSPILLVASAAVLLVGILFAFFYKKRS